MKLASAEIMIRLPYLLDSIVAQKDLASAFSHSLGQNRKSVTATRMSVPGGKADEIRAKADTGA